jgi:hypothetical protein
LLCAILFCSYSGKRKRVVGKRDGDRGSARAGERGEDVCAIDERSHGSRDRKLEEEEGSLRGKQ